MSCLVPHDARTLAKAPTVATDNLADRKHLNLLVLVFISSALNSEIVLHLLHCPSLSAPSHVPFYGTKGWGCAAEGSSMLSKADA